MLQKHKIYSAVYKVIALLGLFFLATQINPSFASTLANYHDSDGIEQIVQHPSNVIPGFFPIYDIYSYWDSLNLDPYHYDFSSIQGCAQFPILGADCGFMMPVAGAVTSGFGYRWGSAHTGVDMDLKMGDSVHAAFDGIVRMSTWYYGYGNCVVVRHYNGLETLYGHLSKRIVKVGDAISAGQTIGLGGSTGYSTGPHLHFEIRFMGKALNPESIIDFKNDSLRKDTMFFDHTSFAVAKPAYHGYVATGQKTGYYKKPVYYRAGRKVAYKYTPVKKSYKAVPKTSAVKTKTNNAAKPKPSAIKPKPQAVKPKTTVKKTGVR